MVELSVVLSPLEEAALRKVGYGGEAPLLPGHARRLLQLDLVEWHGWRRFSQLSAVDVATPWVPAVSNTNRLGRDCRTYAVGL